MHRARLERFWCRALAHPVLSRRASNNMTTTIILLAGDCHAAVRKPRARGARRARHAATGDAQLPRTAAGDAPAAHGGARICRRGGRFGLPRGGRGPYLAAGLPLWVATRRNGRYHLPAGGA